MADEHELAGEPHGKVLCIEDEEINLRVLEAILARMLGVTMIKARSGAEGVALARSERPDLVLLDMHLPDFGGLDVIRSLNLEIAAGLRVIILTADALSMDILKAMSLGAHSYWVKPINAARLEEGVRRALGSAARSAQAQNGNAPH